MTAGGEWERALSALYSTEAARLVVLSTWIVGRHSLAEELVHDTFARLLERPIALDEEDKLLAYVRAAVVNRSRSRIRRLALERRHQRSLVDAAQIEGPHGDEATREVRTAIASLPRRQREVVVLRFHADLDVAAIAQTLGITAGSVKTHLHRALKTLETRLDDEPTPDRALLATKAPRKDTTT